MAGNPYHMLEVPREFDPSGIAKPFWDATRDKRLVIQCCPRTRQYQFYPRANSRYTGRRGLEWREVSGEGVIFSYTVARLGRGAFRGHEPFYVVVVSLDVGVNIVSNLVHCREGDVAIGVHVVPFWTPLPGGFHLPLFQPG